MSIRVDHVLGYPILSYSNFHSAFRWYLVLLHILSYPILLCLRKISYNEQGYPVFIFSPNTHFISSYPILCTTTTYPILSYPALGWYLVLSILSILSYHYPHIVPIPYPCLNRQCSSSSQASPYWRGKSTGGVWICALLSIPDKKPGDLVGLEGRELSLLQQARGLPVNAIVEAVPCEDLPTHLQPKPSPSAHSHRPIS